MKLAGAIDRIFAAEHAVSGHRDRRGRRLAPQIAWLAVAIFICDRAVEFLGGGRESASRPCRALRCFRATMGPPPPSRAAAPADGLAAGATAAG